MLPSFRRFVAITLLNLGLVQALHAADSEVPPEPRVVTMELAPFGTLRMPAPPSATLEADKALKLERGSLKVRALKNAGLDHELLKRMLAAAGLATGLIRNDSELRPFAAGPLRGWQFEVNGGKGPRTVIAQLLAGKAILHFEIEGSDGPALEAALAIAAAVQWDAR